MSHTSKRVTSRHMSHHFQSLRYAIFVLALLVALVPTFTLTACDTPASSSHVTSSQLLSEEVPAYTGQPSVEVDDDKPSFSDEELSYARDNEGFESFSELDDLGRCGSVTVCVGPETMPQEGEERGSIGMIKPSVGRPQNIILLMVHISITDAIWWVGSSLERMPTSAILLQERVR